MPLADMNRPPDWAVAQAGVIVARWGMDYPGEQLAEVDAALIQLLTHRLMLTVVGNRHEPSDQPAG